MKIRPLYDRVLAKRVAEEARTSGGIYIPDTAKEKPLEAIVVAIGSGKILENGQSQEPSVRVGERILIAKYLGSEVTFDGEDHVILRSEEILAVIEK